MRTISLTTLVLVSMALTIAACKPDKEKKTVDRSGSLCDQAMSKAASCDLISEGVTPCETSPSVSELIGLSIVGSEPPDSDMGKCLTDCYMNMPCDELTQLTCGDNTGGNDAPQYHSCLNDCLAQYGFHCADRTDILLPSSVCDGYNDCDDGSDEQNCSPDSFFDCTDGTKIAKAFQCDGRNDCDDGSDEENCPDDFTCNDGSATLSKYAVCDGYNDCNDGSDEQGCAQFTCKDDSQINLAKRCDGENDCPDGSDEEGCAEDLCPN